MNSNFTSQASARILDRKRAHAKKYLPNQRRFPEFYSSNRQPYNEMNTAYILREDPRFKATIAATARAFNISEADLLSASQRQPISTARMVAALLLRKNLRASPGDIAVALNRTDEGWTFRALRVASDLRDVEPKTAAAIAAAENELGTGMETRKTAVA